MRFFSTVVSVALAGFAAIVSAQTGSSTKSNAITAPITGDTITAGKPFDIKWTNTVGSEVTLILKSGNPNALTTISTIISNLPNTGSYTWIPPSTLPAGTTYAIQISYDSNPLDDNYSDQFTVDSTVTASASTSTASSTSSASSSTSSSSASTTSSASLTSSTSSAVSTTFTTASNSSTTTTSKTSSKTGSSTTSASASASTTAAGAPASAANSNLSSPLAVIIALLATALFLH